MNRPTALKAKNQRTVHALAAKHQALAGGGAAKLERDAAGVEISSSSRAREQSSQFVFLKLFKVVCAP
eukprot:SAG11_NODE_3628_length_2326_cov_3.714414_1_plen_68_part_00